MVFRRQNLDARKDKDLTLSADGEGMIQRTIVHQTYTQAQYTWMDILDKTSDTHSAPNEQQRQIANTAASNGREETIVSTKRAIVPLDSSRDTSTGMMKTVETATARKELFQMDATIGTLSSGSAVVMMEALEIPLLFLLQLLSISSVMVVAAKRCLE